MKKYNKIDEKEILESYNKNTVIHYFNARKRGTFINTYLTTPNLRSVLKENIEGKDVLDIGCAFGEDIEWCLKNKVKSITGIEINEHFIKLAKQNQFLKNIQIYNLSAYDVNILNLKFDIIYANLVFDQIENLDLVFNKLSSILNKNGKIVFSVVHPLNSLTNDYFINNKNYFTPKSHNNKIPYYTRNFEIYSNLFHKNDLYIEKIIEAKPLNSAKFKFPVNYVKYSKLPGIVIFSVIKKN